MASSFSADSLSLAAHGFVLPVGLRVDDLRIEAHGPSAEIADGGFTWSATQPVTVVANVHEGSIAAFIEHKSGGTVSGVSVSARDETLTIDATARVIIPVRAAAICRLVIEDSRRLVVELVDVSLAPARGLIEAQLAQINPILNAEDFPFDAEIVSAEAQDGVVTVRALARPR
jgi:hypothetical protein